MANFTTLLDVDDFINSLSSVGLLTTSSPPLQQQPPFLLPPLTSASTATTTLSSSSFNDSNNNSFTNTTASPNNNDTTMATCTECDVNFDDLYRVLIQCFVVILFGYFAGRSGLISASQAQGLGMFVSKFSLPALLLKNMIELDFSTVNWMFLLSVLIAKASVFILVIGVTLLVKHPINLGYAGLFGIFSTQSNDFAVGYPILQALYGKSHKEYLSYLYLVAPISLVVLNPIGFTMLEIHKTRTQHKKELEENGSGNDPQKSSSLCEAMGNVVKGVLTNPIVLMTFLGIIGHFVLDGTVPPYLDDILTVLGQAYNATALFLLGLSMVGKIKGNLGLGLLVPILLITAKSILLPLTIWQVVGSLVDSHNGTYSLSMYGFIYGTFPAAPSVFLYANNYVIGEDIIARAIVLGTFLSAPLMFASGKMITVMVSESMDHRAELGEASFDISIVSLIASVWVLAVFIFGKKWRLIPHRFTFALIISQMLACVGMMTYYTHGRHDPNAIHHYPIIILLLVGVFSARVWTALISIIMCLILTRSLCSVLRFQIWFWFVGFGVPVFLTGIIFMVGRHHLVREVDPTFHFGFYQTVISAGLLCTCIIVTITSIVVWQRKERKKEHLQSTTPPHSLPHTFSSPPEPSSPLNRSRTSHGTFDECDSLHVRGGGDGGGGNDDGSIVTRSQNGSARYQLAKSQSIEDLIPRPREATEHHQVRGRTMSDDIMTEHISERTCLLNQCSAEQRHSCQRQLRNYAVQNIVEEEVSEEEFQVAKGVSNKMHEEYQSSHHLIVLLALLLSMFVGLFLCMWRLVHSERSGIYLEMEFLDSFLNYGQGLIFLAVFGFDTKLFFSPLIRRFRRWMASSEVVGLPKSSQLDKTTRDVSRQFSIYHKDNCTRDIVRDYPIGAKLYKNVFIGTEFCNWVIESGLAKDKEGAVLYGRHLLLGRVISHVMGQQHFQDAPYYYRFLDRAVENSC